MMPTHPESFPEVVLYALQSCTHCRRAKDFLLDHQVPFKTVYLDFLVGEERSTVLRRLKDINPTVSFPTITVGGSVIVGFKEEELRRALMLSPQDRA